MTKTQLVDARAVDGQLLLMWQLRNGSYRSQLVAVDNGAALVALRDAATSLLTEPTGSAS